ncbi:hypothetical protein PHLGIDRAFT_108542 [Phlebiopsis gigantea 11061_1 CR5-6]|uniref:RING-type domain-containing protein n=1 Tax=Phlebiopsis gigantea (strain 11061_1 CR5-6) TaxID=745531 RepID=A0A0C3RV95_PHLG1|nr:hypothetical protein PHLGIDRAFT_108542 [Phlebiopsis gigantea 11061_1 CR5-6]
MSSYSYADVPNDNIICCICRTPFVEPLKTRTCSHTFCKECILTALGVSKFCPIDRWPLALDDLSPADPVVRNLVDELFVLCPNRELGCLATPQRQLLPSHLAESCLFIQVGCEDSLCDRQVPRGSAKHIDHVDNLFGTIDDHSTDKEVSDGSSCPSVIILCPHTPHGCSWKGPRGELESSHLPACSYESIKGFLSIYSTKVQTLADDNALLRRKVDALEGWVSALTVENEDFKRALGPWLCLQVHETSPNATTSRCTTEMIPGRSSQRTRAHSNQVETMPSGIQRSNGSASAGNPYTHSHFPPSTAGQGPPPNSPPHVPIVAPLNLGTSLHRTFLSLRESIVTLSAAVDSLARRQDVALATEAMRMNEEIRSLRVVIHGLRMQMHTIMMDRNAQIMPSSSTSRPPGSDTLPAVPPPSHPAATSWLNLPIGPISFTGPRFPPYAYPQTQSQGVSGPKL